ncbi:MAG: hypothetical protein WBD36_11400 [Bacteroidota bacterium]
MRLFPVILVLAFAPAVVLSQTSPHGALRIPCQACHTTDSWKMRPDASFEHTQTGFSLEGQHAAVACVDCHQSLKFQGTSQRCSSCHTDVHKSQLGANCLRCHTTTTWKIADMIQKHQQTRFPLLGKHALLNCQDCHSNTGVHQYVGTPTSCIGCHRTAYQNTSNPAHAAAGFSTDCIQCHKISAQTWGTGFDHMMTAFPLTGAHRSVQCASCHAGAVFKSTSKDCYVCHHVQYSTAASPNHVAAGFATQCEPCHSTTAWKPATFTHDNTRFPLSGAHRAVPCNDCHVNNQFASLSTNCIDCHRSDFAATVNPNHQALGFPQTCTLCHNMNAWAPASFDHNATKLPLTGKHALTDCLSCHTNNNYQLTFSDCYQCHQADFQRPTSPNHVSANFSHQCQTCHTTGGWTPATFDHNTTKFALTGKHTSVACLSCHVNSNYQLVYTDCYQCHQADFQTPTNPNHVAGGFSHQCQTCHTTGGWTPASFDHNTTKFALTGKHTSVACLSCHVNSNYQLAYTDCYQCHQADFQKPTNPNHVSANFSHQCQTCHTTTAWLPSTFDHDGQYFRIYSGAHRGRWTSCSDCHTTTSYASFTCTTCHTQTNTNSEHQGVSGYVYASPSCYSCHRGV